MSQSVCCGDVLSLHQWNSFSIYFFYLELLTKSYSRIRGKWKKWHFSTVGCFLGGSLCCCSSRKNADCLLVILMLWQECWLLFACKESTPVTKQSPPAFCFSQEFVTAVLVFFCSTHLDYPQGVNLGSAAYLPNIYASMTCPRLSLFRYLATAFPRCHQMWQMYDKHHPGTFPSCSICGKWLPCVCFALFFFVHEKDRG